MKVAHPKKTLREKISRALRKGRIPLEIARSLGVPMLLIADVAMWESTTQQWSGQGAGSSR